MMTPVVGGVLEVLEVGVVLVVVAEVSVLGVVELLVGVLEVGMVIIGVTLVLVEVNESVFRVEEVLVEVLEVGMVVVRGIVLEVEGMILSVSENESANSFMVINFIDGISLSISISISSSSRPRSRSRSGANSPPSPKGMFPLLSVAVASEGNLTILCLLPESKHKLRFNNLFKRSSISTIFI